MLNWGLLWQHRNLFFFLTKNFTNTFFSPPLSMIPAQCAVKALTVSTTAFCPHQNTQKRAPSGQSNRRGRRAEKWAKHLTFPHFSRGAVLTTGPPHHHHHHHYGVLLNKLKYMHHYHNIQLQLFFMLCTPIFSPSFTSHTKRTGHWKDVMSFSPGCLLRGISEWLTLMPWTNHHWVSGCENDENLDSYEAVTRCIKVTGETVSLQPVCFRVDLLSVKLLLKP